MLSPEQKAAFINSQVAMFNAEIARMVADNQVSVSYGVVCKYGAEEFNEVFDRYEPIIGHNAVLMFFRE